MDAFYHEKGKRDEFELLSSALRTCTASLKSDPCVIHY